MSASVDRILISTEATGAHVFIRLFAVDFDSYFVNVGTECAFGMAVRVADVVAADFAFSANYAYSTHVILHLPDAYFYLP